MSPLIDFYLGRRPDHRGRRLDEILRQDDDWLEYNHDFIQWLFPLREPSAAAPRAPVLDEETIEAFRENGALRRQLRQSFLRLLSFYGLSWRAGDVVRSANWPQRKDNWFTRPTHNDLRITRILKSLHTLGLEIEAEALVTGLKELAAASPDCGASEETWRYWQRAVAE